MSTITLAVPALSCAHCVRQVRATLSAVAGITGCTVDLAAKRVRIDAADAQALATAQARLADEGYPATVVS